MGKKRHRGEGKRKVEEDSDEEVRGSAPKKSKPEKKSDNVPLQLPRMNWDQLKPFKKCFWNGPTGQSEPSEELKLRRKDVGVVVKGNLQGCPPPVDSASDPNLPPSFGAYFQAANLHHPTTVQKQGWPTILAGSNVLAIAPTGSGKTLAYGLPLAHMAVSWSQNTTTGAKPTCLILLPTRELALQVVSVLKGIRQGGKALGCAVLYGGQSKQDQLDKLLAMAGALHLLIATPGRLLDILQSETPSLLQETRALVVDEADRMLSLGFRDQLDAIIACIRPDRQTVLFTATFPNRLREAGEVWAPNAVVLRCAAVVIKDTVQQRLERDAANDAGHTSCASVVEGESSVEHSGWSSVTLSPRIKQHIHICAAHKRPRLLLKCLDRIQQQDRAQQRRQRSGVVIFCNTIKTLRFVQQLLSRQSPSRASHNFADEDGVAGKKRAAKERGVADRVYRLAVLHGQMPQPRREEELANFRAGKTDVLLATDVAARGLDIKRVQHVINYDFPSTIEQYCHRIGRTGRGGGSRTGEDAGEGDAVIGEAYSLFTRNFAPLAKELVHLLRACKQDVEKNLLAVVDEYERKEGGGGEPPGDDEEGEEEKDEDEGEEEEDKEEEEEEE